jgi:rhodanese-related sulfurtransferase
MFNLLKLFTPKPKAYKNLTGTAFQGEYKNAYKSVLIDVRTPSEFASGSIMGARNINIMSPRFKDTISQLPKDKEYFLFCRSGSRSAQACKIMAKEGFKVANLKGGIHEWPS